MVNIDKKTLKFIINFHQKRILTFQYGKIVLYFQHDNKPYNILVNGMGKFKPVIKGDDVAYTPIYEYRVRQVREKLPGRSPVENQRDLNK